MLHVPFTVTVYPSAIVISPADIPLVLSGIVMFSLMVLALVLMIELAPRLGPPKATAELILAAVIDPSAYCAVANVPDSLVVAIDASGKVCVAEKVLAVPVSA